ncbi:alpha-amylase family glycosyl hydrolase [Nocardioides cavernaquae]|uniref:Alpha-amylase n=1 Tax=Nocardioides cavernaquae TaxID=2321396 RepID=A0A3A5H7F1_9ACTN|nr:alpha-amylase family glycosyl hydrolase [Nocardioides cavernaquae]RJS46593.1 alpha-amylase [Nocardioides cavernaquae]
MSHLAASEWWRTAVIYQVYPRSFADSDGDGIGDLPGIAARLDSLAALGVDALWFSPFYPSPQNDAGYDVADYCDIEPEYGTLADFDALLARAHGLGMKVVVDLVPNHSSSAHRWFQEALAAPPGSPERARYLFRPGAGPDGAQAPNNWQSCFGGPAWTRVVEPDGTPGEWYLHLFDSSQPDFDWSNPWVREQFREILRFWLDRGVDGFRVDVAHGLIKENGLPDNPNGPDDFFAPTPFWAQDEVHDIYRDWRKVLDEYDGDRMMCGEVWVTPLSKLATWVRPDEMHQAFNFVHLSTAWDAPALRGTIDDSLAAFHEVGAPSTWVLSNHDVVRHATRLGFAPDAWLFHGIGPDTVDLPDPELALRRARAATLLMLALPGSAYLYQGEELGLPEAVDIPDEARQDPAWHRTAGERYGRDGCRVPIPWEADAPAYGFNDTGASWLPQPADWAAYARDAQEHDPASTLHLYRTALAERRGHDLGGGELLWVEDAGDNVLAFSNRDIVVIANLGTTPVPLPAGSTVLARSSGGGPDLGTDEAAWLVPAVRR